MEETLKLTDWSASGHVLFENENWSCANHPHLIQIIWILIDLIICTFPVFFVITAAIVSDRRLDSIAEFQNFEYEKKINVKNEKVRAELQSEYSLCLCPDAVSMPYLRYESKGGNSETKPKQIINSKDALNSLQHVFSTKSEARFTDEKKEHCIFLQLDVDTTLRLDEMAACRENSEDSLQNIVPLVGLSSEAVPHPLKHQDSDFSSDVSWEDDFVGIHEDGLHMPLWNDPDTDIRQPEKGHDKSLEQDPNVMQGETQNETSVIRKHKESLNEIRKHCSHSSDPEESNALKGSQRCKNVKQKDDECVSSSGSQIFQSKGIFSNLPEDNKCNIVEKSTSEIASSEHLAISYAEKVNSKRGTAQELPAVFVPGDEERSMPKSHTKEMVLNGSNRCFAAPKYDAEKLITGENLGNLRTSLTNQDERCLNLETEDLRAVEENSIQGSGKKMNEFSEETYEKESKFRIDEDSNSEGNPEDISSKFCDDLVHIEDEIYLEPVQDTVLADDVISFETEEEYQPIHLHSIEEHNYQSSNQKKENSGFHSNRRRKCSGQIEHRGGKRIRCGSPSRVSFVGAGTKEIKLRQSDDVYVDLKRRQIHINLRNDLPEERKSFQGKNQELNFKMKTFMNTDNVNKAHAYRYPHEELALILQTGLGGMPTMGRNTNNSVNISDLSVADRKEDKSKDESHYKEDMTSHYKFALLKEIISTWYFFPMLDRFMEYCLPSSLQAFFERLTNGPPVSLAERMSYEWLRLQSFNTLPSSTQGAAIRLAQSGFYYTGQGTHTRCYACNVEHEGWNNTDNPHEVHMRISPNCPFLGGNPIYPNFPIIPETMHSGNNRERSGSSATPVIPILQERTASSVPEVQPIIIPSISHSSMLHLDEMSVPQSVVTNGYHQVPSETAQVEARRENLETQGSSVSRKQQQTDSNPSTGTSQPESSPTSSSLSHPQQPTIDAENTQYTSPGNFVLRIPTRQVEDAGVDPTPQTMSERPKHPEYAPLSSRISSYTSWPTRLDQTPQQMAEAGFFYAGIMDYTRCFQCGGGLRNWEPGDNPWIEHARWYPQCAYVLGKRGQKFVNAVLKKQAELLAAQNAEQNNSCSTTTATTTTTTIRSGTNTSSESQSIQQPISQSGLPRYFQNPNENDIAKKLIEEMGYQRERVREAILEVKRRRGQQEITIEHAIDLLLADEERRGRAGRQNEAATMEELIQESGRLTLHDDSSPPPTATANTTAPPPQPTTTTTTESCQCSGHPHQVAGVRSSGQQQSGQTNQSTGLGRVSSVPQSRQNTSGPMSIVVDVPSSSPSFDNQEGHQSSKSTAANRPSSPPLLQAISLPAIDAELLREEYLRLRDQNVCKICMERNVELAFLPCGHLVCCEVCGQALRFCPICRAKINASVKTYLS